MSAYQWPREPLTDPRWRSDVCQHRHRTREAAEDCETREWRRRERSGEYRPGDSNARRGAAAEALKAFQAATEDRRRARIWAEPEDEPRVDVTEHVVSLLDMITTSMDWGSDFWTDADLPSFITLCRLLKFEEMPR